MAIVKEVDIRVNTKQAVTDTEKLTKAIERLSDSQEEANKQAEKTAEDAKKRLEEQKKATEEARKPLNKLKNGFKGLGTAIKATGIGLLIAGLAKLSIAFSNNTAVSKVFKETFETISLVFGNFVSSIVTAVREVSNASKGFEALGKVLLGIVNIALTPLKIQFLSIKNAINIAKLAWEKSFFGGKDKDKIEQLQKDIEQTTDKIKEIGEKVKTSATDIVENFGQAIKEVGQTATKAVDNVSKISIKNAKDLAKQLVKMREESQIAIATNELILKTKQKEAEEQRIIRDNVELDIATRTKANEKLKKILKESNDLQIANAQKTIDLAKLEVKASGGSQQSKLELLRAELAYQDVLETTKGFLAEQDTNRASLNAEAIELENSRIESEAERAKAKRDFEAEQIENEAKKIEQQKANLEIEKKNILDDLERKRLLYKEGTQARLDAEQEYLTAKQELDQKEKTLNDQKADAEKKLDQDVANAKIGIAKNTLGLIQEIAGEGSKIGKALAIGQATISAVEGTVNAFKTASSSPITTAFPAYPFIQAGLAGAFGVGQIAKIKSADPSGADGGSALGGGGQSAPAVTAPSFNLVEGTGTDQIADTIQNQDRPIKAFVVSSDVSTAQELDRNTVESATL